MIVIGAIILLCTLINSFGNLGSHCLKLSTSLALESNFLNGCIEKLRKIRKGKIELKDN
jgi:hypothetical protein